MRGCGCDKNNDIECHCGNDEKNKEAIKEETNAASPSVSGRPRSCPSKIGI